MDPGDDAGLDLIAAGDDQPRRGEWMRVVWSDARRRRRLVAAGVVLVLLGGAGYGWARTHPGPLPVPVLSIRATGVDSGSPGATSGFVRRGSLLVNLVLTVRATERAGETIRFQGLQGGGVTPASASFVDLKAAEQGDITSPAKVDCQSWTGSFAGVDASFRLIRDGRTREITVPVDQGADPSVLDALAAPCAQYGQLHPLRVTSVVETLDPVLPVVHLLWTVRNPTQTAYVLNGSGAFSDSTTQSSVLPGSEAGGMPPLPLGPQGTAQARTTLAVADCQHPETFLDPGQSFNLSGVSAVSSTDVAAGDGSVQVDLPDEATTRAVHLAQQACSGSASVLLDRLVITMAARGQTAAVTVQASGLLAQRAGSGPVVPTGGLRVWVARAFPYDTPVPAVPLGPGVGQVDAQGRFAFTSRLAAADCRTQSELDSPAGSVSLVVRGAREFVFQVPVTTIILTGHSQCPSARYVAGPVG